MQGWVQWLIYVLAGLGALVVICTIGALIYWIVTIIRYKIEDYKGRYLKYEYYYLKHKGNEYISEKYGKNFTLKLDTGKDYVFEIGYNLEKYTIQGGCLYDEKGIYLGKIEKIRIWG